MLTGDSGQHGQRGRQAQLLNAQMPPPEGRGRDSAGKCGVEQAIRSGENHHAGETERPPFLLTQGWERGGWHPYQGLFTESSSFMKPFCSIHLSLRNLDLQGQCVTEASVPSGRHIRGQG